MTTISAHEEKSAAMDNATPAGIIGKASNLIQTIAQKDITQLVLRVAVAVPFWKSGDLKWDGFLQLSEIAPLLFENEFQLHILGSTYPFPFPYAVAFGAGLGEIILPVLLVLGIFTRFAALGILAMTVIIQLTVPTGWPVHLTWAAIALALMAWGPGRIAVDSFLQRLYR
ncbi:DoxX family protein [Ahrensia kielensis]|uniref:DoxX family protein n=1 Tax=Ahrensia kielensis TaxID=76980 RepID=UPI00036A358A|nr:DoxX family protein [Ahrensia kielensis]